jgi:hypothetical protein
VSEETQDGLAVVTVSSGHGIKLTAARMASETEYNTVLLTATVMPEDVENKSVDWTIEWQTPESEYASGKTVTDYCTVTPTADGALTAKVRCLQPFEAYIDVKATTREGGYTAVCTVVFEGRPSGMTVTCTELSPEDGYYNLIAGPKEYVFDLNLTNEWNQVGDKFYDFTTSVQGYGEFQAQDKRKDSYNAEYYYDPGERVAEHVSGRRNRGRETDDPCKKDGADVRVGAGDRGRGPDRDERLQVGRRERVLRRDGDELDRTDRDDKGQAGIHGEQHNPGQQHDRILRR